MKSISKCIAKIAFMIIIFISFPKYAFASGMEGIGFLIIFGPLLIICINFGKFLYLKSNKELKLSFGPFVGVAITELFLILFSNYPVMLFIVLLSLISGIESYKIVESYDSLGLFIRGLFYGIMAVFPNLFLLREEDQTFINVLKTPNKLVCATILAFIFPTISVIFIYILIT